MKIRHTILFFLAFVLCCCMIPAIAVSAEDTEKPVIILDPGHGGVDGGTTAGIRYEKTYNLIMAQYLREELLSHGGFEVHLTRENDDTYLKFFPRAINIVKYDADLILSLHCNSSTYAYVNGMEAITSLIDRYAAYDLGNLILGKVCEATGMRNRGIFTREDTGDSLGVYYWDSEKNWDMPGAWYLGKVSDYFSINTWAAKFGAPSLIVEHGYLSNSSDRELMDKDDILRSIAKAEAAALIEYYYGHTHSYTAEKVVDFPSNCTMNGTKSYRCTVCGIKAETEQLPAAPDAHFYRQIGSAAATCGADGFIEYTCQISHNLNAGGYGNSVHNFTEVLPKKDHDYRVVSEQAPVGCREGQRTEACGNCGDTLITVLPGGEHDYEKTKETPPTCTMPGQIEYHCFTCSVGYTENIPAEGHGNDGSGNCPVCGVKLNGETDSPDTVQTACSHSFEERSRTDASCEKDGTVLSVCTLCGTETEERIPAAGHSYSDEICSRCGEAAPKTPVRRDLSNLLRNPLFLAVVTIVILQAVFFTAILLRGRRRTHKTSGKTHNYKKHQ